MISPTDLLTYVIRPVLKDLDLWSEEAERLVLGTACQESECGRWLHQRGGGPALGIYQMEPATHNDIWQNFLLHRPELRDRVNALASAGVSERLNLEGNLLYATAMCRVHYLRVPEAIPPDLGRQAVYWKRYYNTEQGAGSVADYIANWARFIPAGVISI